MLNSASDGSEASKLVILFQEYLKHDLEKKKKQFQC